VLGIVLALGATLLLGIALEFRRVRHLYAAIISIRCLATSG